MCHQQCPQCSVMLTKTLACGHTRRIECHLVYKQGYTIPCLEDCPKTLACGHSCAKK